MKHGLPALLVLLLGYASPPSMPMERLLLESFASNRAVIAHAVSHQQDQVPTLDTSVFRARYGQADRYERTFIDRLLALYYRFGGSSPDTTSYVLGDIDGNGRQDTLFTHVTMIGATVQSRSWWNREGERMWQHELLDPYSWIADSDLYQWDTRNPWVTFAVAVGSPATLHRREEFPGVGREMAINQATWHFRELGVSVRPSEYAEYLDGFEGLLLNYPETSITAGLHIWYEPLRRFVVYYHP